MGWRTAALISPGFKKRKVPRELLLDPPPRKRRWWIWVPFVALCLTGLLFAIDAAAYEERFGESGAGRLYFKGDGAALHLKTKVAIKVTGLIVRTELTQAFTNQTDEWQEAVYVFPLPDTAAVNFMQMQIGERVITARVEEREQAKKIYEQAKAAGKQAALTEQERPNLFTQSVANIAPGETIEVTLRYLDVAPYRDGSFSMRVPMTITPRYIPGSNLEEPLVPDANRITPPVTAATRDSHRAEISAILMLGFDVSAITSDYHQVVPQRQGFGYDVELSGGDVSMDRDFVLRWKPVAGAKPTSTFYKEAVDGSEYGLLMVLPPAMNRAKRVPRDMIFVIDTSGSMKGTSIRQAKNALQRALEVNLGPRDRFNIIEFDNDYSMLFGESQPVSEMSRRLAGRFVQRLKADGGTEMERPLRAALTGSSDPQLLKHIIFITDGAVGNEDALFRLIHDHLGDARLFTVGIGSAPNSFFMKKAAEFGGGTFTFIGDAQEVSVRIETLFEKLERPRAHDIQVDWNGSAPEEVYPAQLPALYDSEPVIVVARGDYFASGARVSARLGDEPWEAEMPVIEADSGSGIGALWARRKIEELEDSLIRGAASNQVRDAIVQVALTHQLVSRFTSLVAVETYVSRMPDDPLSSSRVPNKLAKGQVIQMPQTATYADLAFLAGLIALLAGVACHIAGRRV